MADRAGFDQNNRGSLIALSNDGQRTPVSLWADPITHELLVTGGGSTSSLYPDTTVLWDDDFSIGFCGWEKLHQTPSGTSWATGINNPLSLSNHGTFGNHSLLLQTNDIRSSTFGSQVFAIKRWTMQYQVKPTQLAVFDGWFSYGSDNNDDGNTNNSGGAPRYILFGIDSQTPQASSTSLASNLGTLGQRCYFIAQWLQFNESTGKRVCKLYLNTASSIPYGQPGYSSPDNGNYTDTGYVVNLPYNGNKRNVNYFSMTVDIANQQYRSIQFNDKIFDLTNCPAGTIAAPISPQDPLFNDLGFNGGLNALVSVNNRTNTDTTASFMELHRARMLWT